MKQHLYEDWKICSVKPVFSLWAGLADAGTSTL